MLTGQARDRDRRLSRPLLLALLAIVAVGCGGNETGAKTEDPAVMLDRGDGDSVTSSKNRRQSIIEDAKFRGVDYWATGNEPGWRLEIAPERILLVTNYGVDEFDFPTPVPSVSRQGGWTVYQTRAEGHSLRVEIRDTECFDDMSGERFESTVVLELDGTTYRGCGQAL